MNCPNCQGQNPYIAKFCMYCGHPLVTACPNCQYENVHYAKFCIECGHSMGQKVPITTQQQPDIQENTLQKFIPKEYAEKLENVRKVQTMKGERRIVSILFCDVKGSTSIAEQLDPEEWAEIMNQAFEFLISPIYTYEGTLARLMGDSVLAFFGAPIAHEDDAKRAILAGMEIIKNIQPFKEKINKQYNLDFDVRVGINTGLVVVGGVGSDLFMEYTALGDAINIAARLQQSAEPGTIQIGEDTYKQVSGYFDFEPGEDITLKGKAEPVRAYRLKGTKEQPFDVRGMTKVNNPLVGRSNELNILVDAMDSVKKGNGQIVCLIGEAGLGKSRLLKEARDVWLSNLPQVRPFGQISSRWNQVLGLSYESSRPYGLIQRLIRNYIGLLSNDSPDQIRKKIFETLSLVDSSPNQEWLDLFEMLLGVKELEDSYDLSGENLKRKIYSEMLKNLEMLASEGPTVFVIDDLHWSDPASAEFLVHLFQLADHLPILFLCSFRSHHHSQAWFVKQAAEMSYSHRYVQINLLPLSELESNQLIDSYLDGGNLSQKIRIMILRKSDGNPFYTEEVIRGLINDEILVHDHETGSWIMNTSINDIAIPENLSALITARIDRLNETTKNVLQIASVIGISFNYSILELINDVTDELDLEISSLLQMGLIRELTREPEVEYIFRQVLTQETAYHTILIKHRRVYHLRVGEAILQLYPDRIEEFSTLLGHHFYNAKDSRAFQYFRMDGDTALRLYANIEAINYYGKAIEVAEWSDDYRLEDVEDLYLRRGRAFELESQFKNALNCYQELEQRARGVEDQRIELKALIAQALVYSVPSSEFDSKLGSSIIEKARKIAEEIDEREALAKIYWISMNLNRFNQSFRDAQQAGEKAVALARELNLVEQLAYSLNDISHAYNINGQVGRARETSLEAVELWEKMNDLPMLADSLAGLAAISVYIGDFDDAYKYSDRAYAISQSTKNIWGQSYSRYAIGLVDLERGDFSLAIKHFEQSMKDAEKSKFTAGVVLIRTFLCVVYSEIGDYQKAIAVIDEKNYPNTDNLAVTRAFSFGASLYAYARADNIEKAEESMADFGDGFEGAYFLANYYFVLGKCYLYLKKKDYQNVIKLTNETFKVLNDSGVKFLNPELLLILGIVYLEQGLFEEAKTKFEEGILEAKRLGSRKSLWQLKYYLGLWYQRQGKPQEAENCFDQAIELVQFISDHIIEPDYKEKFLSRVEVQELQKHSPQVQLRS